MTHCGLQAIRTVPIVFVHVPDPVGVGFIDSFGGSYGPQESA